jgi:hypothetical protein
MLRSLSSQNLNRPVWQLGYLEVHHPLVRLRNRLSSPPSLCQRLKIPGTVDSPKEEGTMSLPQMWPRSQPKPTASAQSFKWSTSRLHKDAPSEIRARAWDSSTRRSSRNWVSSSRGKSQKTREWIPLGLINKRAVVSQLESNPIQIRIFFSAPFRLPKTATSSRLCKDRCLWLTKTWRTSQTRTRA